MGADQGDLKWHTVVVRDDGYRLHYSPTEDEARAIYADASKDPQTVGAYVYDIRGRLIALTTKRVSE